MQIMYEEGLYTDATLVVQGEAFQVHRAVLAAASGVFHSMFRHDMREGEPQCAHACYGRSLRNTDCWLCICIDALLHVHEVACICKLQINLTMQALQLPSSCMRLLKNLASALGQNSNVAYLIDDSRPPHALSFGIHTHSLLVHRQRKAGCLAWSVVTDCKAAGGLHVWQLSHLHQAV